MRFRQHEPNEGGSSSEPDGASETGLDEIRARSQNLLDAADAVIDQTVTGDNERFLAGVRQHGGQ